MQRKLWTKCKILWAIQHLFLTHQYSGLLLIFISSAFKPTFQNSPVESSKQAAEKGNVTISCRPEAAPRAVIKWMKNGLEIGKVLPSGDLQLSFLTKADSGIYTCVAENSLGTANSNCALVVQGKNRALWNVKYHVKLCKHQSHTSLINYVK